MSKRSTFISTSLLVVAAIAVVLLSIGSNVRQIDLLAANKQRSTLLGVLQQHGVSLARELKVQTFWSEGYKNASAGNTQWMSEYYGQFLDRVLGYDSVYVLDGHDQTIFAYENGADSALAEFNHHRAHIDDLIVAVRGSSTSIHLQETSFDIGKGQAVVHRAASDVRLIDGKPSMVVVSTILPDAALDEPMASPPPLMVATLAVDAPYLRTVGETFGFKALSWSDGKSDPEDSFAELNGSNGEPVGRLHWHSDRPGVDLEHRIAPGLIVSMALFVLLTAYLLYRTNRQAGEIKAHNTALATDNETLEHRVSERTRLLEVTLANLSKGVVLLAQDGHVIMSNEQTKDLLEVASDDEAAEVLLSALEEDQSDFNGVERRRSSVTSRRKDRACPSGRIVEIRSADLPNSDCIVTINDVTALKRRQAELENATASANAASEAKSRFLSTMSHEMRTPLNGLIGALALVQKSDLDAQQKELISVAQEASEALLVHISDVLDFSKLEAEKFELDIKPFDLHRMAKSVAGIVTAQVENQRNKLVLDIAEDVPRHVVGDSVRLRQIVLNYVTNANKFTRHGTIRLSMKSTGGDAETARVRISVSDTGIGIPQDRLQDLFQEFSMIESGYTRKCAGTGLGLAISKRLAEAMGGSVGVESELGKGSTFWSEVQLEKCEGAEQFETEFEISEKGFGGLKILLVDDNATNRLIGSKLLTSGGHLVTLAKNGREAVDLASATRFDAILMDISMPEMDGLEATRHIRKLAEPLSAVPIVALTANAIIGDREKFLAAGMDDYLTKPFRLADIQEKLAKLVQMAPVSPSPEVQLPDSEISRDGALDIAELELLGEATSDDIVISAIETYLSELKIRYAELQSALGTHQDESIKTVCHAIAGASRSIGALKLGDAAKAAELACVDGDAQKAALLATQLEPLFAEAERALAAYRDNLAARSGDRAGAKAA